MPRLSNALLRHARAINPLLALLLRPCRDLPSAHNELRWLREHVNERLAREFGDAKDVPEQLRRRCVVKLCRQRATGVPLQYLLGSQPFGDLDVLCRKGVLIPRQATESYTIRLAHILLSTVSPRKPTHILDFCTGTGCIALLIYAILRPSLPVTVTGIDISTTALSLARHNLAHNFPPVSDSTPVRFEHGNILLSGAALEAEAAAARKQRGWWYGDQGADVVTANPPYISQQGFDVDTERSVRNFEPKLALVPSAGDEQQMRPEDVFYPAIVRRAEGLGARVLLMEVAGTEQAVRVARFVRENAGGWWKRIEIWQDVPDGREILEGEEKAEDVGFTFRGTGPGRSVVCWRDEPEPDPAPAPGERGNLDTGQKL